MRPKCLEMTAFGSYAGTTTIPFSDLKQGLYLVTGNTGAGKTTIFDAIVFALYGEASGQERNADMMHCDYVDKSVDTVVRFHFSQSGKEYTVTRTIHYRKKRGMENQFGQRDIYAQLIEPERDPVDGSERVTKRCEALLGLNAEQFRKIIMLAQGEFKEFLKADSDKKNEILGKLFDNSAYVHYQNLLGGARNELKKRRDTQIVSLHTLMQNRFQFPEELTQEEHVLFLPGNPELNKNLDTLIAEEKAVSTELENKEKQIQAYLEELNSQKGAAESLNAQFDSLKKAHEHYAELLKQQPRIDQQRVQYERAETAVHRAKPKVDQFIKAKDNLETTQAEIEALQEALLTQTLTVDKAKALVNDDDQNKVRVISLNTEIQKITEQLPHYQELETKLKSKRSAEDAIATAASERAEYAKALSETETAIERLQALLDKLEGIEIQVAQREIEYKAAEADLDTLSGKTGIEKKVKEIQRKEKQLEKEQQSLLSATNNALAAEQNYHELYQRFIDGQAGLLAMRLAKDIQENDQAKCPVCSSKLCREHIPNFAPLLEGTPTESEIEDAKSDFEKKENLRNAQKEKHAKLDADIRAHKESLMNEVEKLLPECLTWEVLTSQGFLTRTIKTFSDKVEEAKNKLKQAESRKNDKVVYKEDLESKKEEKQNIKESIDSCLKAEQTNNIKAKALEAAICELKEHLSYEDKKVAIRQQRTLNLELERISKAIQENAKTLETAQSQVNTTKGSLTEKERTIEKLVQEKTDAKEEMDSALRFCNFADLEEVSLALLPIGAADHEQWLKIEQEVLATYDNDCKNTRNTIRNLDEQLQGKTYTNMEELSQKIKEARESLATVNASRRKRENLLNNHRDILKEVEKITQMLHQTESAWQRIEMLGNLAVGTAGEGGKLSFDRYVMGTVFREILDMANRRLDIMSGGKYELVHKSSSDRKNTKAGLDIEVLDNGTGRVRPSSSLSGGEAFITSMALALGLSDVVQNHAGGRKLDALFIDEGFGSLDGDVLDKALNILNQLTEGNRLVGIISHIDKLDECIPQKIRVKNNEHGSTLALELA